MPYQSVKRFNRILPETKGKEVRKDAIRSTVRQRHHAVGFLDRILRLRPQFDVRLVARLNVKGIGQAFNGPAVYSLSIQRLCRYLDHHPTPAGDFGICVADSRIEPENVKAAHSVFTQKFGADRRYRQIAELQTFGHSDNHAGLQICDIVCSGLLYPVSCFAYCSDRVDNIHVQPGAAELRKRYGRQLAKLQYRYQVSANRYGGGLVVSDNIARRNGSLMFR